ncbi:MAG: ABC transporter ATP-binding protein [Dehalococcoidales bacterium]
MRVSFTGMRSAVIPEKDRGRDTMDMPILEVRNVSMAFGVLVVLKGVSFSVPRGNILVIIGPNGAGKSTLLKLISGLLPLQEGEVWFRQQRLNRIAPHRIASLGITQLLQDIQLFSNMSVIENVMVGCHLRAKADFMSSGLRLPQARADEQSVFETAMSQLSMVGLREKAWANPGSLSWGQQKLVGLARALATGSELLLLDEPYSGLLTDEVGELNQLILELQRKEITILIVEHLTDILMGIANQVIVLDYGKKIAEGTPSEIQQNKRVIDAYLGGGELESKGT